MLVLTGAPEEEGRCLFLQVEIMLWFIEHRCAMDTSFQHGFSHILWQLCTGVPGGMSRVAFIVRKLLGNLVCTEIDACLVFELGRKYSRMSPMCTW